MNKKASNPRPPGTYTWKDLKESTRQRALKLEGDLGDLQKAPGSYTRAQIENSMTAYKPTRPTDPGLSLWACCGLAMLAGFVIGFYLAISTGLAGGV